MMKDGGGAHVHNTPTSIFRAFLPVNILIVHKVSSIQWPNLFVNSAPGHHSRTSYPIHLSNGIVRDVLSTEVCHHIRQCKAPQRSRFSNFSNSSNQCWKTQFRLLGRSI